MALPTKYARAVWNAEGVLATWLPDRQLHVGDVISRGSQDAGLRVETRIDRLIHHEQLSPVVGRPGADRLLFQDGVSFGASGEVKAAGANFAARFACADAFLFAASGGTVTEYQRLADMRTALMSLRARAAWQDGWYLVTAVRSFSVCTLVVAETDGAEVKVEADAAQLGVPTTIRAGAGVTVTSGRAATWALGPSTPLYEALFVRRRLLRDDVQNAYLDGTTKATAAPEQTQTSGEEVVRATPERIGLLDSEVKSS